MERCTSVLERNRGEGKRQRGWQGCRRDCSPLQWLWCGLSIKSDWRLGCQGLNGERRSEQEDGRIRTRERSRRKKRKSRAIQTFSKHWRNKTSLGAQVWKKDPCLLSVGQCNVFIVVATRQREHPTNAVTCCSVFCFCFTCLFYVFLLYVLTNAPALYLSLTDSHQFLFCYHRQVIMKFGGGGGGGYWLRRNPLTFAVEPIKGADARVCFALHLILWGDVRL